MNGRNGLAIIVPDAMAFKLTPKASRLVVTTVNGAPKELKSQLNKFIRKKWKPNYDSSKENKIAMNISVKEWSIANGLTALSLLSFGGLYLSLIIIILIGTIMALQQIYIGQKSKYQYKIIYDMGVSRDEIAHILKKQITNTFSYPIVLPILIAVIFAIYAQVVFGELISQKNIIIYNTIVTLVVFTIIYGLYYLATYKLYEKNVLSFIYDDN